MNKPIQSNVVAFARALAYVCVRGGGGGGGS